MIMKSYFVNENQEQPLSRLHYDPGTSLEEMKKSRKSPLGVSEANFDLVTSRSLIARIKLFETGPLNILDARTSDMHVHLVREQVDWGKFMWCSRVKICRKSPDLYCKGRKESKQLQAIPQEVNRQLLTSEGGVIFFRPVRVGFVVNEM